jgi:DNA-binding LytR/AlgR family response regulator
MIRCLILDPELASANWLERMCRQLPFLSVVGKFQSAFDAYVHMQHEKVDVLFIDSDISDMTLVEFFKIIHQKPIVIMTSITGFYALDAFSYDATDYLIKPIEMQRFIRSVNKASELYRLKQLAIENPVAAQAEIQTRQKNVLFINSEYKMIRIDIPKIQYIEGLKDYLKIYLEQPKPYLTMMRMKAIEEKLPSPDFVRVHRSFIVNLHFVDMIQKNKLIIGQRELPIGDMYQEQFYRALDAL